MPGDRALCQTQDVRYLKDNNICTNILFKVNRQIYLIYAVDRATESLKVKLTSS